MNWPAVPAVNAEGDATPLRLDGRAVFARGGDLAAGRGALPARVISRNGGGRLREGVSAGADGGPLSCGDRELNAGGGSFPASGVRIARASRRVGVAVRVATVVEAIFFESSILRQKHEYTRKTPTMYTPRKERRAPWLDL